MSLLATIKRALFGKNLTMKRATAIADQIRAKSDGAAYDQLPRFTFTTPADSPEVTGAPSHIKITNILTWEKLVDAYLSQGAEDFPDLVKPRKLKIVSKELEADAMRYRFLRDHHDCHFGWNSYGNVAFSIEVPLDDSHFTNGSENPDGLIDEIMKMKGVLP